MHAKAHTEVTPDLSIALLDLERSTQVVDGELELVTIPQDVRYSLERRDRPGVVAEGLFVGLDGLVDAAYGMREGCWWWSVSLYSRR